MANRFFAHQAWNLIKGRVDLFATVLMSGTSPVLKAWSYPGVQSGASGSYATAGTTSSPQGGFGTASEGAEGIKTVARTAQGLWTVTLQDNFQRLLLLNGHIGLAGGTAAPISIAENTTITSMTASGGSKVGVAFLSATATAADPDDGAYVHLHFVLQNSTAP